MDSRVIDHQSKPSLEFSETYFQPLPYDARFSKVKFTRQSPFNGLSENLSTIRFSLPALTGPYTYDLTQVSLTQCSNY